MRIVVVGTTGTIGRAVVDGLSPDHDVVTVGHQGGEFRVDRGSKEPIADLFGSVARW